MALFAAVGAQFLSHYLQSRRIKKEEYNSIYQELVFPFLPEVLIYYETHTNFRKGHDVTKDLNADELIESIRKKSQLGNIKLLIRYNELIKTDYFYDGRGDAKNIGVLRFFYEYLSDVLMILKRMKKDNDLTKSVEMIHKKYGIWILVSEEMGYEDATNVMSYDFLLDDNFYKEISQRKLNSLIADSTESTESHSKNRKIILKILLNEFSKNGELDVEVIRKLKESLVSNSEY